MGATAPRRGRTGANGPNQNRARIPRGPARGPSDRELKEDEGQAERWRRQGPEHMHLPGRARDLEFQRGFQGALSPLSYFIFTMSL